MTDTDTTDLSAELRSFIEAMPKCELHVHLEGTLEPALKLALAERNGIEMSETTVEAIEATYLFDSLASFLAVYYPAMRVLVTEDDFHDLAFAYLTKAASQNVRHAEMFFDPQAHTDRGIPFETVINGYHRAVTRAPELGMTASLIMCFLRDLSAESALATLETALAFKDRIVGVGLDSDERGNPPAKFAEVFARARAAGFLLTMHCDIDQDGSIEHLRQVLQDIEVDRIDHGTNIVESPELVALAAERGIGLTCCPVSNSFVTADMKAAEMVQLLQQGVKVTVNSDDPAYFAGYITENFTSLASFAGLQTDDVLRLSRNAFEVAWLPRADKERYLAEVDAFGAR